MSLQDQLLKAGLIDKKKAKQADKEKRKTAKVQRKSSEPSVDEAKLQAQKAREEKAERDRQLNAARKAEEEKRAVAAQIKQLIQSNRQPKDKGDVAYNFTDDGKIKKMYISNLLQLRLSKGQLGIVKLGEAYELVPAAVAAKIAQRDESYVVALNQASAAPDEDDPYKDYEIPDDLMW